ncbi:MAG: hydrophobic protein [Acidimicrobiales bacterium]
MLLILLVLLLALILAGVGFAVHVLWIIAVIVFVLWLVGFALGRGFSGGAGARRRRGWYRW